MVIIGGGVGGASIAYHLAQLGERDVILLDRNELTSGSTFHSAGLVGQLRSSVALTRLMMYSVSLYRQLDCGWVQSGGIRLACTPEREQEVNRQVAWARTFGLPLELISAEQAQELFPLMSTEGVRCASYLPTDGYLDPSLLTTALADGARAGGCRVFTHTRVTGIDVRDGRVRGVQTEWGEVEAEIVVNAGGMFAAEIGRMAGIRVPVIPFAHEYLVTQPFRERSGEDHLPTLRDPDLLIYFREEGGGLVMGGYERDSAPWALDEHLVDRIPANFNGRLLEEDWPRFEEIAENSRSRVPIMEQITVTRLINGPEAFTPDNEFCLGESDVARVLRRGRLLRPRPRRRRRDRQADGRVDPRRRAVLGRLGDGHPPLRPALPLALLHAEAHEGGLRDLLRHPLSRATSARPGGRCGSPAHTSGTPTTAPRSARSPAGSASTGTSNEPAGDESLRPRGWAGMHWSPAIGAEHRATREAAGLFDESSFAKLEVSGPGAAALLEHLCDNRVARDVGADHLHADAQQPRRDRVRLHRHPGR